MIENLPIGTIIEIDGYDEKDGNSSLVIIVGYSESPLDQYGLKSETKIVETYQIGQSEYTTLYVDSCEHWAKQKELRIVYVPVEQNLSDTTKNKE